MENDLSDNQRRFICRVLFLLVCALPTCIVVYFATHQRTADQWAQLIQAELGVKTSIGGVESPRPGQYVFRDVKLFDDEGQEFFVSLSANVSLGHTNLIEFTTPVQVKRKGMSCFLEGSAERIIKPWSGSKLWEITFNEIEITTRRASEYEVASFHMNRLDARLQSSPQGPYIQLESLLAGKSGPGSEDWGWLKLSKNPTTREFQVEFDTTQYGAVPCWLAQHWFPALDSLGIDSHFSGDATIKTIGAGSSCLLSGEFRNVSLPAIAKVPPSYIAAAKSLHVKDVRFENSRWMNGGKAEICLDGNRYFEIRNPDYYVPNPQPAEVISEVIQAAFWEDSRSSAIRR